MKTLKQRNYNLEVCTNLISKITYAVSNQPDSIDRSCKLEQLLVAICHYRWTQRYTFARNNSPPHLLQNSSCRCKPCRDLPQRHTAGLRSKSCCQLGKFSTCSDRLHTHSSRSNIGHFETDGCNFWGEVRTVLDTRYMQLRTLPFRRILKTRHLLHCLISLWNVLGSWRFLRKHTL